MPRGALYSGIMLDLFGHETWMFGFPSMFSVNGTCLLGFLRPFAAYE